MTDYLGEEIATARTALDGSKDGKGCRSRSLSGASPRWKRPTSGSSPSTPRTTASGSRRPASTTSSSTKPTPTRTAAPTPRSTASPTQAPSAPRTSTPSCGRSAGCTGPRRHFATATPVANSMAELWVMQSHLHPDLLASVDLRAFDAWAANFAPTPPWSSLPTAPPTGCRPGSPGSRTSRVAHLYRQVADVRTSEDLDLPGPIARRRPGRDRRRGTQRRPRRLRRRPGLACRTHPQPGRRPERGQHVEGHRRRPPAALDLRLVGEAPADRQRQVDCRRPADRRDPPRHPRPSLHRRDQPAHLRPGASSSCSATFHPAADGWNAYDELRACSSAAVSTTARSLHARRQDRRRQGQALRRLLRRHRLGPDRINRDHGRRNQRPDRAIAMHHLDVDGDPPTSNNETAESSDRATRTGSPRTCATSPRAASTPTWQTLERKAVLIAQVTRGDPPDRDVDDIGDRPLLRRGEGARHRRPSCVGEGRRRRRRRPSHPARTFPPRRPAPTPPHLRDRHARAEKAGAPQVTFRPWSVV